VTDRRVPGRAPILFTSAASEGVQSLSSTEKGELLASLDWLRDRGWLPSAVRRNIGDKAFSVAPVSDDLRIIYRQLSGDDLQRQGKDDASQGFLLYAIRRGELFSGEETLEDRQ
jgi:hypothetical protein